MIENKNTHKTFCGWPLPEAVVKLYRRGSAETFEQGSIIGDRGVIKDFEIQAPTFCSLYLIQHCAGKCLPTSPQTVKTKTPICRVWWFPWCKYSHYGRFQATNIPGAGKKCSPLHFTRPQLLFPSHTLWWGASENASLPMSGPLWGRPLTSLTLLQTVLDLREEQWHAETKCKLTR